MVGVRRAGDCFEQPESEILLARAAEGIMTAGCTMMHTKEQKYWLNAAHLQESPEAEVDSPRSVCVSYEEEDTCHMRRRIHTHAHAPSEAEVDSPRSAFQQPVDPRADS